MDSSDRDLLQRFTHQRDEDAFRILVKRHLGLVHGVARRITASDELAKDTVQNTFIRLARRATLIPHDITLAAWLHRTCRSLAIDLVRSEASRRKLEMKAATSPLPESSSAPDWAQMTPVIDSLISHLSPADQDVVLLRFFEDLSYPEVGLQLGLSEEAARKRALRAIEKLRVLLGKRGIATTFAALNSMLPAHAAGPATSALAASVFQVTQGLSPTVPAGMLSHLLTMTATHKISLAFATLLLLATTAYTTPWRDPVPSVTVMAPLAKTSEREPITTASPSSLRNFPATAGGRLERLRAILAMEDPIARRREMVALIDSIPAAGFEEMAENFSSLGRKDRDEEQKLLLFAWTHADPENALAYGTKTKMSQPMATYWATYAPDAALAWAAAHPLSSDHGLSQVNLHWYAVLGGMAIHDPGRSIRLIQEKVEKEVYPEEFHSRQTPEMDRLDCFPLLCSAMADQADPVGVLLTGATDERTRNEIVVSAAFAKVGMLSSYVREDEPAEEAARLLLAHPAAAAQSDQTAAVYSHVFGDWAEIDRPSALDALASAPGEVRRAALGGVTERIAGTDLPAAIGVLDSATREECQLFLSNLVRQVIQGNGYSTQPADPAAATEEFLQICDESIRDQATQQSLSLWLSRDATAARAWMADHSLPASVTDQLPQP